MYLRKPAVVLTRIDRSGDRARTIWVVPGIAVVDHIETLRNLQCSCVIRVSALLRSDRARADVEHGHGTACDGANRGGLRTEYDWIAGSASRSVQGEQPRAESPIGQ